MPLDNRKFSQYNLDEKKPDDREIRRLCPAASALTASLFDDNEKLLAANLFRYLQYMPQDLLIPRQTEATP